MYQPTLVPRGLITASWTVIYPINISSTGKQHRKLALAQCPTRTPSALYIAECVRFLGLPAAFEPEKRHPADPLVFGRVRVQIRDPATLQPLNPNVRTKRQLVKEVARYYPGIEMKMNEQDPRMPAMAAASRSEASSVVEALAKDAAGGAATTTTATTTSTTTAAASAASVSGGSGGSSSSGKKKKGKRK
ncbi:hypothetical protein DFJ77DRAFT_453021 [Powellomyces hirtus]|nr:hypothetical protein DFJ77DRAFT_453021 [Powellomyces hirtus]